MGGCALLFAGQGSQHAQMLPWLERSDAAAALLEQLAGVLGAAWRERLSDPAWAHSNRVAQPLVVGTALAAWAALAQRLTAPVIAVAGYSVGELAACAAAGACALAQAIELAQQRAIRMDDAVRGRDTGLLSIQGLAEPQVLARYAGLEPAIRIARDHVLYAGTAEALAAVEQALGDDSGCRRVDVALASHSSWMRSAAAGYAEVLANAALRPARIPVVTALDGIATRDPQALRAALARQIDHPLEWQRTLATLAERRPACVLEIGPGNALAKMWSRQHPQIPVRSIDDFAQVDGAAAWIARHG